MATTWVTGRRWGGDLAALAPVVVALPVLAPRDGGWGLAATQLLAGAAAVALPAVVGEVRRWPRPATALLLVWAAGLVLATAVATYRADMVRPLLQYATAPVLVLATTRLWRRQWFPGLLLVLLVLTFALYQHQAWQVWWVASDSGADYWRALSWHNQAAVLTGMFGVLFLGASMVASRVMRAGLGLLAAAGLGTTLLSGSRGGTLMTVAAALLVALVGWRSARRSGEPAHRVLVVPLAVGVLAAALAGTLLAMQPTETGSPLSQRDKSAVATGLARIEHSEAALGMFAARPLVGHGPGSYGALARIWNDPEGNLTSSAHNEYAEVAGEVGVAGLVALVGVLVGAVVLGWRVLRTPPTSARPDDLRGPLVVGGLGAAALFLAHSAVDFDWNYPVLSSMAAIGVALLLPWARDDRPGAGRWLAVAAGGGLGVVLAGALVLSLVETTATAPWNEAAAVARARQALEDGRPADALDALAATRRWNPAGYEAAAVADRARFAIDGDVDELVAATRSRSHWFAGRARAALALAHAGHSAPAAALVAALHEDLDRHAAWGVRSSRLLAVEAEVATAVAAEGCAAAREVVTDALAADANEDPGAGLPAVADEVLAERLATEGCPDAQ